MADPLPAPGAPRATFAQHLTAALVAIATLAIHLELMVRRSGTALFTFDSAEYALAGRTLAHSGRLATPFVHPSLLPALHGPPFPLVVGQPLVPLLNALLFALFGDHPALTLVPTAIAFVACTMLTAALARRAARFADIGPGGAGAGGTASGGTALRALPLLAATAFALSPVTLRYATEGLSELPFVALFTAALVLLADFGERPRPYLLGVLLGLAHLTRPVGAPLLPIWLAAAAWVAPRGARLRSAGFVLLGFLPLATVLALYQWVTTGHPFPGGTSYLLLARLEPEFSVARLNRMLPPPSPWSYLAAHPGALLHKVASLAPGFLYEALTRGGRLMGALFVLRLVAPAAPPERRFTLALAALGAGLAALALLTVPDPRMLLPLLPALFALGLDEAWRLARGRGFGARGASALVIGLTLVSCELPTLRAWAEAWRDPQPAEGRFREAEWAALGERLGRVLPRAGLIASDAAPWVAWYADRDVTLVPLEPGDLAQLDRLQPLGAVVLTNEWLVRQPGEERWAQWFEGTASDSGWAVADIVSAGRLRARVFVPQRGPAKPGPTPGGPRGTPPHASGGP